MKTLKIRAAFAGYAINFNSGDYSRIALGSGLWQSTNAITSIKLVSGLALNVTQYSHFALYGIKSA